MTPRDLAAEIHDYLTSHGPATATEIALGVRARRAEVVDALAHGGFSRGERPEGGNPRSFYWAASRPVPQSESGTSSTYADLSVVGPSLTLPLVGDYRVSQNARIVAFLRDGRDHTTAEIHAACGTSRLNSRLSELRSRGFVIETTRLDGVPAGPHAQTYRLLATPDGPLGESESFPAFPSRDSDSPSVAA